jgi:4-hydroxyphenylpyruvate dioxygenase
MATQVADETTVTGFANPMGTDGFEFVEYTAPDIELLRSLFTKMGFPEVARHRSKNVTLHKQGDCNFIINAEPGSYAEEYAKAHGPSACAMAFRVKDAKAAHERALKLGATNVQVSRGDGELDIPAIEGIGGSRLFFVDRYGQGGSIYEVDFDFHPDWQQRMAQADSKLTYIDHLTHNVNRGRFLRAALQLPRDPLFRHRGETDRPLLQGDDLALWQDPYPAQREPGRQEPDRGIPPRI